MRRIFLGRLLALLPLVTATNFPYEEIQLADSDVGNFSAIAFGNRSVVPAASERPECRAQPGTPDWPSDQEWTRLNASLDGALLKPLPPGIVCYAGPLYDADRCKFLMFEGGQERFYIDDPLTVLTAWPEGDSCPVRMGRAGAAGEGNCTQGGFPVYVINATTVRQVQIGVNFARNKGLRLVVKNTGHDFVGRSTGAGSLSIWTHHLKSFEFLPEYTEGEYSGMAARVGPGLEAWELYHYMDLYNMTVVVPGGSTVGAYGGWMAGGGHSTLASYYGLGSDQPLSLEVVTADGRFVTANTTVNEDLFYALRGGGPGSYGIVTSAIVKAYPAINVTESTIRFSVSTGNSTSGPAWGSPPWGNSSGGWNSTVPSNFSFPPLNISIPPSNFSFPNVTTPPFNFTFPPSNSSRPSNSTRNRPVTINDVETFWSGVNAYQRYGKTICEAGGTAYSYISSLGPSGFSFRTTIEIPAKTHKEVYDFLQPLITSLNDLGIPVVNSQPVSSLSWGATRKGQGDSPGSSRFATRLFPAAVWDDDDAFDRAMKAVRNTVEAGYTFHGIHLMPTSETAGYPGGGGVNPAFRTAVMHADVFDTVGGFGPSGSAVQAQVDAHARLDSFMNQIRDATPGGGAYVNECDVQEPDWQHSFWGDKYERLLEIKKERDPWDVFWAPATVGSEGWEVRTADGLPTQNGPLCRVQGGSGV